MDAGLVHDFESGVLVATDPLIKELAPKDDASSRLVEALKRRGRLRMLGPTSVTWEYLADIERFVRQRYETHQADKFLKGADPMLVALAKTHEATIITLERYNVPPCDRTSGRIKGKVRLPYVAAGRSLRRSSPAWSRSDRKSA